MSDLEKRLRDAATPMKLGELRPLPTRELYGKAAGALAAKDARIAELEAIANAANARSDASNEMVKNWGATINTERNSLLDRAKAAEARIAELEKALAPFAEAAAIFKAEYGDLMEPKTGCSIRFQFLDDARTTLNTETRHG